MILLCVWAPNWKVEEQHLALKYATQACGIFFTFMSEFLISFCFIFISFFFFLSLISLVNHLQSFSYPPRDTTMMIKGDHTHPCHPEESNNLLWQPFVGLFSGRSDGALSIQLSMYLFTEQLPSHMYRAASMTVEGENYKIDNIKSRIDQ